MASTVTIDGKEYQVYREQEYWDKIGSGYWGSDEPKNLLIARPCVVCGDQLLGTPDSLHDVERPQCEKGHHGSRPGVYYV